MPRLSKLLEKAEDQAISRFGGWYERHKEKFSFYIPTGLILWYVYGLFLNSLKLGIDQTFHDPDHTITTIWVWNPFRNFLVVLTPFGLVTTAVIVLLACLIMKKGYNRFSGYKYTHDSRGFDILPDATHGSSGFLTEKEMREFLELGTVREVTGMMLGKTKRHPDDPDKYALYVAHRMRAGDNNNLLCIGAPGSGKSRGFIIPFLMGVARRKESVIVTDPKGELFEKLSPYFREHGHYVKAVNFLDMEHSDGWNCLYGLDTETQLVQTVANTIIANTSGSNESDDFWSRAELNLLMAMLHYVANLKDDRGNLLPIEQRGLGKIYEMLSKLSIAEINRVFAELPSDHPARGPYGLFLKARENLWGNIIIGLGNRLAIFQSQLVDKITRNHDVDLTRPGKEPCAYFVIISAQDSTYRFLSSLFFSLAIPQLSDYARLHCEGGRLPVLVNFCLDEYCNIGYMDGMADALNSIRGFNMSCQIVVQSLSQWQEKYPGKEWENQLATFSQTMYLGCNDLASAKYISDKCGKVTISVTNNQMPLMPLFSPVYTSTRPYSQTRSNTARELMQQDEVLRLDNKKCIALFQGHKPALLYKLTPEELPDYATLKSCRIIDYTPEWKLREQEQEKKEKKTKQDLPKEPAEPTKPQTAEDLPEQDFDIIGDANQIYLAKVEPEDDLEYECAPFSSDRYESDGARTSDIAVPEPQDLRPSKKEKRKKERSQKEVSPSVAAPRAVEQTDGQDDEEELQDILDACDLPFFPPETARVLENAIERLYYSDSFRIGNASLPQKRVRSRLRCLDNMILRDTVSKLSANLDHSVKNSTAYTMVTLFNCISESESDLMVDPDLNAMGAPGAEWAGR